MRYEVLVGLTAEVAGITQLLQSLGRWLGSVLSVALSVGALGFQLACHLDHVFVLSSHTMARVPNIINLITPVHDSGVTN